jgi:hypothetical protein
MPGTSLRTRDLVDIVAAGDTFVAGRIVARAFANAEITTELDSL